MGGTCGGGTAECRRRRLRRRPVGGCGRRRIGPRRGHPTRRVARASRHAGRRRPRWASAVPLARALRAGRRRPVRRPRAPRRRAHRADDRPPSGRRDRPVRERQVVHRPRRPAAARAQRAIARAASHGGPTSSCPATTRSPRSTRRRRTTTRVRSLLVIDQFEEVIADRADRRGGRTSARPPVRPGARRRGRRGDPRRPARGASASSRAHVRDVRGRPDAHRTAVDRGDAAHRPRAGPPHRVHGRARARGDGDR